MRTKLVVTVGLLAGTLAFAQSEQAARNDSAAKNEVVKAEVVKSEMPKELTLTSSRPAPVKTEAPKVDANKDVDRIAEVATPDSQNLSSAPHMNQAEPRVAQPGTEIVIKGFGLASPKVDEVYLTDHKFDMRVKVLEQTENTLKIRVPPFAKPGRMQLMILVTNATGDNPRLLEQPVYVMIEETSTQLAESKKENAKEKQKEGN